MATAQADTLLRHLRRLATEPDGRELTDRELLACFAARRDEEAFTALLRRHGPMVLRVCRGLLGHQQDAEDAFQATFLILARRAGSVRWRDSAAPWLHRVAHHVALKARAAAARRKRSEGRAPAPPPADPLADLTLREALALLDAELCRLPEAYRGPLVLCYLEGQTQDEAARRLGWSKATVRRRLERGRESLRCRLARRGLALPAGLAALALSSRTAPASLTTATARAAARLAAGEASAAVAAEQVAHLVDGGVASLLTKARVAGMLLVLAGMAAAGSAMLTRAPSLPDPPQAQAAEAPPAPDVGSSPATPDGTARTDRYGDPLPPGAVARLGSLRLYHGGQVQDVVLSPDGKLAVSVGEDGNRLWDAATGRELTIAEGIRHSWVCPTRGGLVGIERQENSTRFSDVASGKLTRELPLRLHDSALDLSPDGQTLVWWTLEPKNSKILRTLRFCAVETGEVSDPIILKDDEQVSHFAFSDDAKTLVTQYYNHSIRVWDVVGRKELRGTSKEADYGGMLAVSPDGKVIATAPDGKPIRLWDTGSLKELPPLLGQREEHVNALSFSPDGKLLAVNYPSPVVRLWDMTTRKEVRQLQGKDFQVFRTAFSKDGKFLAGADGGSVTFWDLATGKFRHDFGHTYVIDALAFAPDGRTLITGAAYTDPVIRVWDPLTGKQTGAWNGHTSGIEALAASPDGKTIASGSQDGTVRLWDLATGKELRRLEAHDGMVYAVACAPDGKTLASGGRKHAMHLWDAATGREVGSLGQSENLIIRLSFAPNGGTLATRAVDEKVIRILDPAAGKEVRRLDAPAGQCGPVFSPDGKALAHGGADETIHLWDSATGRELRAFGALPQKDGAPAVGILNIAFSPDGRSVAAVYRDRAVRLWELASGQERARFEGHRGEVVSLAFSPAGDLLASGSVDRTVLVWDMTGRRGAGRHLRGEPNAAELDVLWTDLAGADAPKAYQAVQALAAAGKRAVAFLKEHLPPAGAAGAGRIAKLIALLDSDQFADREKAARELLEMGDVAEPALRAALAGKPSPELRRRAEALLERLDPARSPERLRPLRAVEALEHAATSEARDLIADLAKGAPEARLTQDAKAALARLAGRPAGTP